jgi:hypothetical protein
MKFKSLNLIKRFKGGATTVESVPGWMKEPIQGVVGEAKSQYDSGNLGKVAGTSALQEKAFGSAADNIVNAGQQGADLLSAQQQRLNNMATTPSADVLAAQKAAVVNEAEKATAGINSNFGQAGTLGSARNAVMQGAQNAETTAKLAQVDADYENKMFANRLAAESALGNSVAGSGNLATGTASSLANLGSQERGIEQQGLDADWQALQRYASTVFGSPAKQSAVTNGKGI